MFKHFLVLLDGSPLAESVLPHVVAFARAFTPEVTLLRVVTDSHPAIPIDVFDWQLRKAETEAYLDDVAAHLQNVGIPAETVVIEGEPATSVINYVHHHPVDLLLLSSHGASGLTGWNLGGVARKILLRSPISSLLVRAAQPQRIAQTDLHYQRLLVPLDGSPHAQYVLPFAATLARAYDAQLFLVHVLCQPEMLRLPDLLPEDTALIEQWMALNRSAAEQYFAYIKHQVPDTAEFCLRTGEDVASRLYQFVLDEEIDLVIMSAHGYSCCKQYPYGRVTAKFISYDTTPLLLIQDLPAAEIQPTVAEIVARDIGPLYRAEERFTG